MALNIGKETAVLRAMTVGQLQDRYAGVFGEAVRSRHREYLIRKIAWRLQADAEGGLSERARRRAEELAVDAEVRTMPPRSADAADTARPAAPPRHDRRLPSAGAAITREYKGRTLRVVVLTDGFEYEGQRFRTLSAVAKAITGSHINGYRFFGLKEAS